jgi:hypothetical protein
MLLYFLQLHGQVSDLKDDDYFYPHADFSNCEWSLFEILEGFFQWYGKDFNSD